MRLLFHFKYIFEMIWRKYHSYRIFNVVCVQIILMSLEIGILTVAIYKQLLIQPTQFREGHKGR